MTRAVPTALTVMNELVPLASPAASEHVIVGSAVVLHTQGWATSGVITGASRPGERRSVTVIAPEAEGPALATVRV